MSDTLKRAMRGRYNAVYHSIVHTAVIRRFFYMKKKFDIPLRPFNGRKIEPAQENPLSRANPQAARSTSLCVAASRTTPFLPTFSRPASNCGFTRQTPCAPPDVTAFATGNTWRKEMNDTSTLKNWISSCSISRVTWRIIRALPGSPRVYRSAASRQAPHSPHPPHTPSARHFAAYSL